MPELLAKIKETLRPHYLRDIGTAYEIGLFYCMTSDRAIYEQSMPGRKNKNNVLTALVFTNADGSKRYPLMIIGSDKKPRAFKKKTGQELGLDY